MWWWWVVLSCFECVYVCGCGCVCGWVGGGGSVLGVCATVAVLVGVRCVRAGSESKSLSEARNPNIRGSGRAQILADNRGSDLIGSEPRIPLVPHPSLGILPSLGSGGWLGSGPDPRLGYNLCGVSAAHLMGWYTSETPTQGEMIREPLRIRMLKADRPRRGEPATPGYESGRLWKTRSLASIPSSCGVMRRPVSGL